MKYAQQRKQQRRFTGIRSGTGGACSPRRPFFAIAVLGGTWVLLSTLIATQIEHTQHASRVTTTTTTNEHEFDPDFAAKITNIMSVLVPTWFSTTDAAASKEGPLAPDADVGQLVPAPHWSVRYQEWDAICTLKRYPHLFKNFCKTRKPSSCDVEAFQAYYKDHHAVEHITPGCPRAEAICYARRYTYLYEPYCEDSDTKCDYYALRLHYENSAAGERDNRLSWGCDFTQTHLPPASPGGGGPFLRRHGILP
jgi:hypothetical protein